ncbi:hypothetical protein FB567DRAFT_590215 [Paraphoma chrysanthemicola]|uniref:Uncharacterized protein n=1 Tax=Paraphoma chrysanthemicola TaxID=798071 RepID=A0A8K0RAV4_9PLEO|nr:hypothetical protein FB567DRAFT_590215 [Paraphoma chrysanthemicola]
MFEAQFSDKFEIEQEVIYLIWKEDQIEVTNIGWTKLAEGYSHNARTSAREWDTALQFLIDHSVYVKNLDHIADKVKYEVEAVGEELEQRVSTERTQRDKELNESFRMAHKAIDRHRDSTISVTKLKPFRRATTIAESMRQMVSESHRLHGASELREDAPEQEQDEDDAVGENEGEVIEDQTTEVRSGARDGIRQHAQLALLSVERLSERRRWRQQMHDEIDRGEL